MEGTHKEGKKGRETKEKKRETHAFSLSLYTYVAKRHRCTPGVGCCCFLSLDFFFSCRLFLGNSYSDNKNSNK